jgi:hypothetical protein
MVAKSVAPERISEKSTYTIGEGNAVIIDLSIRGTGIFVPVLAP